jgi:transcriptional repressor NrdR
MICPHCASPNNRVVNSRDAQNGTAIRRRRECLNCGERFTTFETIEENPVRVIKRSGDREPYDQMKVLRGLRSACRKRPVSEEAIRNLVGRVEKTLFGRATKDVESSEIGDLLLAELQGVDEVAHIRFASVYRKFGDLDEFLDALRELQRAQRQPVETRKP